MRIYAIAYASGHPETVGWKSTTKRSGSPAKSHCAIHRPHENEIKVPETRTATNRRASLPVNTRPPSSIPSE